MPIPVPGKLLSDVTTALGQTNAGGMKKDGIATAVRFFFQDVAISDPAEIAKQIRGIDLGWPVVKTDLLPGTKLIAYRHNPQSKIAGLDPFGLYFTIPGTGKGSVGINTDDRRFIRYTVLHRTTVLQSRAATTYLSGFGNVFGGSTQYVIPRASMSLRAVQVQNMINAG